MLIYDTAPLRNPVNDARSMSSTLRELGFSVELLEDASQKEMKRAIDRFGEKLRDGGTGLFYFSGHGIQVSGRNYLIPVKYTITSEDDVEYESVDAGRVLAKMKAARNGMNIVILDACRNNPFPSSFRSASQCLATINAPSGTFISYATAPGSVASDGSGKNGLYTGELIRHMKSPGLKLEEVFKKVRADVQKKSEDKQVPWDASSLTGDFYFVPPTAVPESAPVSTETVIAAATASKPVVAAPRKFRADEETWELVKESNDPDDFKYFLEEFPESPLSSVARLKLRKLKKAQKKLAAKQKPASPSQSAFVSSLKPKNSVESSSPQNKFSIKEGFEKCNGRSFCLRKVANSHSISIFNLKRMATNYGWKGAEKGKQNLKSASLKEKYEKCMGNDNCLRSVAKSHYMALPNLNRMAKVYGWKGAKKEKPERQSLSMKEQYDRCNGRDFCLRKVAIFYSTTLYRLKQVAKEYGWVAPTGTVTDSSTGLMWQKKPDGVQRNWEAAKKYCRDLKWGGFSDWKLPNGKELRHVLRNKHILDPYKISARWDSSYWSSQTASSSYFFKVNFYTGTSISNQKRFKEYVRCVRVEEAQESKKITKKTNESTSKTTSLASIRQTYDKAVKQNSIFGFRNFIKGYEHEQRARYYVNLAKKKLKKLQSVNESTTTSSSEASSGYTKRQAYLDFLEAKVSNTKTALRNFLRKHADTPDAERYRELARKLLKNF